MRRLENELFLVGHMRYNPFSRNFEDYPGSQPKTTFLYYFPHDCSNCCVCCYWTSGIQGKPTLSENENYFARKLRQEASPESFAKELRQGTSLESFTKKLQKRASPESFARKLRQFIMTNYSDALLRRINT